ncbi:MAG: hypothetical protein WBX15_16325 [Thermoanaerobaculia bacterium]
MERSQRPTSGRNAARDSRVITRNDRNDRVITRNDRSSNSGADRNWRGDRQNQNRSPQSSSQWNRGRNDNRNYGSRGSNDRSYGSRRSYDRGYNGGSHGRFVVGSGRVNRIQHYRGGYRVWVGGSRYPFFVPDARFRLFPFRVGISIRLGGYYDPLGYINVYDIGGYRGYDPVYTSGVLHGVVESVDYRRGTAVISDDISGRFVTVVMRSGFDLRPGDQVELSGDWSRSGIFRAYRVNWVGNGYDNRGYDNYGGY